MDAAALLRMVSEPTRHALLDSLRRGERTVSQLSQDTQREASNVSHHLRRLREAGLVSSRADGRQRRYRLADPEVRRLLEQVEQVAGRLGRVGFYAGLELPFDPGFHGYG